MFSLSALLNTTQVKFVSRFASRYTLLLISGASSSILATLSSARLILESSPIARLRQCLITGSEPVNILHLPREIRDLIISELPLSSAISFKLSCHHLHHSGQDLPLLYCQLKEDADELFELSCMLERDKPLGPRKILLCTTCKIFHPQMYFTLDQHFANPMDRRCIGSQGFVVLEPKWIMTFESLQFLHREMSYTDRGPDYNEQQHFYESTRWRARCTASGKSKEEHTRRCQAGCHYEHDWMRPLGDDDGIGIRTTFVIYPEKGAILLENLSLASIATAPSEVVDLCPHVPFNDIRIKQAVHTSYSTALLPDHGNVGKYRAPVELSCPICATQIIIRDQSPENLGSKLSITTIRSFGNGVSAADPRWLNQMTLKVEEQHEEWRYDGTCIY